MHDPTEVSEQSQSDKAQARGGRSASRLRWAVILVLGCALIYSLPRIITAMGRAAGDQVARVLDQAGRSVTNAATGVVDSLAKFVTPEVKNFWETRVLESQKQTRLNVATWRGTLSQRKSKTMWPAAIAEVEVRKPAEVQLFVPLKRGSWDFVVSGKTLYVFAPSLEPAKVSVDNAHTEKLILCTSWRISEQVMLEEAEGELDKMADRMASGQASRIIDLARDGVADFVMQWVVKRYYPDGGGVKVRVIFPGEPIPEGVRPAGDHGE